MTIRINDDLMTFDIDGTIIATATGRTGGWREVTHWPRIFDRDQAITALTICANLAHGLGHGPVGALVSAWPAMALAGSFELLMLLIRADRHARDEANVSATEVPVAPVVAQPSLTMEQKINGRHEIGHSQRAIARDLGIARRKVKQIVD